MSNSTAGKSEHSMTVVGSRLPFLDVGRGQVPVVMLHGLFGCADNWRPIMEDLAGDYRFLSLQFPIDHGGDRPYQSFQSIDQLTDHVERFFDEMALDRAVLCGNSLGGQVAIDYCLRHPERVEKLILAGSAGLYERNLSGGKIGRLSRSLVRAQACEIFHDPVHVTDEVVEDIYAMLADRKYRRFVLRVAKATRDRQMLSELADVRVPTMIIWGRNDTITPPFVADQFCDHIPGAELAFIDQCGHAPPIEQPKQFAHLLHAFLSGTATNGAHVSIKPR
jgi:2-hydroxy-6-oxonona-2,4-dienedioate hydrolase